MSVTATAPPGAEDDDANHALAIDGLPAVAHHLTRAIRELERITWQLGPDDLENGSLLAPIEHRRLCRGHAAWLAFERKDADRAERQRGIAATQRARAVALAARRRP